jgi:hypothetical protein
MLFPLYSIGSQFSAILQYYICIHEIVVTSCIVEMTISEITAYASDNIVFKNRWQASPPRIAAHSDEYLIVKISDYSTVYRDLLIYNKAAIITSQLYTVHCVVACAIKCHLHVPFCTVWISKHLLSRRKVLYPQLCFDFQIKVNELLRRWYTIQDCETQFLIYFNVF